MFGKIKKRKISNGMKRKIRTNEEKKININAAVVHIPFIALRLRIRGKKT